MTTETRKKNLRALAELWGEKYGEDLGLRPGQCFPALTGWRSNPNVSLYRRLPAAKQQGEGGWLLVTSNMHKNPVAEELHELDEGRQCAAIASLNTLLFDIKEKSQLARFDREMEMLVRARADLDLEAYLRGENPHEKRLDAALGRDQEE